MLAIEFQAVEVDVTVAVLTRGQGALAFGFYAVVAMVIGTVLYQLRHTQQRLKT